ncbi:uncharacterized protein LOC110986928 isoform X2 [Acanthaster planci]|uniref:Uncharacterized protein LOC110986928 isoform X2 n=1 Tax=Acanthaster planci TaxID=133434 RepID=A0A8B7ZJ84_ACAPL|nr:uncharacterized protein LOC110986928 isoform X2 [Acanthaster planci]
MALPDPNKQTFPFIQNPTQFLASPNCPTPTKTNDSSAVSLKHSAIQLPALVHSGEGDSSKEVAQQHTTTVSLPKVKKTFPLKKTEPSQMRGTRIPENFREVAVEPMPYQCQFFRSTTKIKSVPVTKRHRDMFSAAARSKPGPLAKTKHMSFYTKPFLWQAKEKISNPIEMENLPSRFLEEEENLREVRGQKRKYSIPSHRQGYNDLYVGGNPSHMAEKFDYKTEADNLRHMVLPDNAQELYMGRGIKLPETHSLNRRRKDWRDKIDAEYALPNSAPAEVSEPSVTTAATMSTVATVDSAPAGRAEAQPTTKSRYTLSHPLPRVTRSHSISHHDADSRSSVASERSGASSRKPERRKSHPTDGARRNSVASRKGSIAGKAPKDQPRHEEAKVKDQPAQPEEAASAAGEEVDMEREEEGAGDASTAVEVQTIPEESKDEVVEDNRPDSEMEMEAVEEDPSRLGVHPGSSSPKGASPNPLTSIDITLHISASQKDELSERFKKLDSNKDGHITFQELSGVLPESLTKSQRKFIKEVYEAVSSSTFFGLEEFVGVTCLAEMLTKLPEPVKDSYDAIDFAAIQQSIMQFVMMFSSVDRQQTGAISIPSLLEVVSMATDRDLVSDQNQTGQILTAVGKNLTSTIDKVEFLAFLPYFLQLR